MIQGALSYLTSDRKSIRLTGTIEIGITKDLHATMRIDIPLDTIEEMTGEIEILIDDTAKGPDLDQGQFQEDLQPGADLVQGSWLMRQTVEHHQECRER